MSDEKQLRELLDLALAGARRGAEILKTSFGNITLQHAEVKGQSDYVSEVDRRSEAAIAELLLKGLPDSTFLGEETGQAQGSGCWRWIVDPLDGTTNFLQGLPIFAVSIGLERCVPGQPWGDMMLGVVMQPLTGETWTARRGQGAWKDGKQIHISRKTDLTQALLATGFPFRAKQELKTYLRTFEELFMRSSGIRRAGSAALDLCWTAQGVFDGFWEHHLSPWDVAAGALIIEEAGGIITGFEGETQYLSSGNVVAANRHIHAIMLEVIQATVGP